MENATPCADAQASSAQSEQFPKDAWGFPLADLPEACLPLILSQMGPTDVCRLALINSTWAAAARSDHVWLCALARDLPPSLHLLAHTGLSPLQRYRAMCREGWMVDSGTHVSLVPAGALLKVQLSVVEKLSIIWGDHPQYWDLQARRENTPFPRVASLRLVCWFQIRGQTSVALPPGTYTLHWRMARNAATGPYDLPQLQWPAAPLISRIRQAGSNRTLEGRIDLARAGLEEPPDWTEFPAGSLTVDGGGGGGGAPASRDEHKVHLDVELKEVTDMGGKSGLLLDSLILRQVAR